MSEIENEETSDYPDEVIAIIGLSGRFPDAQSLEQFWKNLIDGSDAVHSLSDQQLKDAGHDVGTIRNDPAFVAAGTSIGDISLFDADLFGYNPQEAALLDPQHRLLLEVCWTALESAGCDPSTTESDIGVYVGKAKNAYLTRYLLPNRPQTAGSEDLLMVLGNESDYLSTAISYRLGLTGPSVNIHTACSTSLVAVHQAKQSLLNYECDVALAGGVCIRLPEGEGYEFNDGNILSSDGHTRTFDADADGTMFGNGAGIVVLKRLSDAQADGDNILALIKGSAINNDGPVRQGFMAPSVEGQARVVQRALADASVSARQITYVEAHGTATPLGDPIEVAGLTQAFTSDTSDRQFCALGSVKSNIGHLDAAAGISGLIKTVLALHHRVLPASINCTQVNPRFELESTPFFINRSTVDWVPGPDGVRYAGVSSFGAGGTNAHVILQETPVLQRVDAPSKPYHLLVWSGNAKLAAEENGENILREISRTQPSQSALADIGYTLQTGRKHCQYRQYVALRTASDAQTTLDKINRIVIRHVPETTPSVVFLFPGQGSQYPEMAITLYRHEPIFRQTVDTCFSLLSPSQQATLKRLLFLETSIDDSLTEELNQTQLTQPALFIIEYSLAKWWLSLGVRPVAMIGHSIGEYVAACLAGVFSLKDALSLVSLRGQLIQTLPSGAMLAIPESADAIVSLMPDTLSLSAENTPVSCVVGGSHEDIDSFAQLLGKKDLECRQLKTSHAFHSMHMAPILDSFKEAVSAYSLNAPSIPMSLVRQGNG